MALIAGSPLGLVGLNSSDPQNNFGEYNGRNRGSGTDGMVSLFTGNRVLRPFGIGLSNDKGDDGKSNGEYVKGNVIHSDDIYNTSLNNIIKRLEGTRAELKFMDFAYLRDVGVYPNNRLMIARRFATPVEDNIMYNNDGGVANSLVTMISWKPPSEDFLEISFGEEWESVSDGDFTGILNEVGKDFRVPGNLGGNLSEGGGVIPLPGSTEVIQRTIFEKMGILEKGASNQIPEGNPNLIKEAKMRKLVTAGKAGTGLTCKVSIKMVCVWEQKYIQGIDPTLAWMDIIAMVGRFGTSTSQTFGLSKQLGNNVKRLLNDPDNIVTKAIEGIKSAIIQIGEKIKDTITNAVAKLSETKPKEEDPEKAKENQLKEKTGALNKLSEGISETAQKIGSATVKKYRERIIGIINALTGLPSTPWHITIGNPLRPTFVSGDMLVQNVKLNLGGNLSFNDLPTKITAEFTLTNSRNWGLQEIMAKFNSGYLRVLSYANDDKGKLVGQSIGDLTLGDDVTPQPVKTDKKSVTQATPTLPKSNTIDDNVAINPDPHSEDSVVDTTKTPPESTEGISIISTETISENITPTSPTIYTFEIEVTMEDKSKSKIASGIGKGVSSNKSRAKSQAIRKAKQNALNKLSSNPDPSTFSESGDVDNL